jgi:hypothetical protein
LGVIKKHAVAPNAIIAIPRNPTVFQRRRRTRSRPGNVSYSDALGKKMTSEAGVLGRSRGLCGGFREVCNEEERI